MESLPDDIQQLRALTFLNVFDNSLQTLPQTIGSLTQLQRFDFYYRNDNVHLPDSIFSLTTLEDWKSMFFGDEGSFTTSAGPNVLPKAFGGLAGLRTLTLYQVDPPLSAWRLTNLRYVSLSYIEGFPQSLGALTNLTELHLESI